MAASAASSPWDFWAYSRDNADVAAEKVAEWLSVLRDYLRFDARSGDVATHSFTDRRDDGSEDDHESGVGDPVETALEAGQLLARATASSDIYCAATAEQHGHQLLLKLLGARNELLVEAAAATIANCSGPMGAKPSVKAFSVRGVEIKVKEMSFSDGGLGWKVWGTALMLADQLAASPALVQGRRVLEIGSGCGLCGLLAAKLGACSVTLTDCVPSVLCNLEENVLHLPAEPAAVLEDCAAGAQQLGAFRHRWSRVGRVDSNENDVQEGECFVNVRYLEWAEDSGLASCKEVGQGEADALTLRQDETFEVIIASDILYQQDDVEAICGVIKKRLAYPAGECHIMHTVRSKALLSKWTTALHTMGLCIEVCNIQPGHQWSGQYSGEDNESDGEQIRQLSEVGRRSDHKAEVEGATMHRADFYEGGFVSLHIQHTISCPEQAFQDTESCTLG